MIIDRICRDSDDFWRSLGYNVYDSARPKTQPSTSSGSDAVAVPESLVREPSVPSIYDIVGKPVPEE